MHEEYLDNIPPGAKQGPDQKLLELYRLRSMCKRSIDTHKNSVFAAMNLGNYSCALALCSEIIAVEAKLELVEGEIHERTGQS